MFSYPDLQQTPLWSPPINSWWKHLQHGARLRTPDLLALFIILSFFLLLQTSI